MAELRKIPFLGTILKKYRRYSLHVLGHRHFPEGRDGLTPVQRRSLWAMYDLKAVDKAHMVSTARAAGETIGKYHPHEPGSVVGAMTNMSQTRTSAPLITGVGNWGTWEDKPAAMRYTKCFLSPYALSFFDPDELAQVPMLPSFDGSYSEPQFLPAPVPHLLLHGAWGMTPGVSGNLPPCTPEWVEAAVLAVIRGKKVPAPEAFAYRHGGVLKALDSSWVGTGVGSATFRPTLRVDEARRAVVLTSLAPGFSVSALCTWLEKKVPAYAGLSSESSDEEEIALYLLCKRGHELRDFARAIKKKCVSRQHFSFLYIDQFIKDDEASYRPVVDGPVAYIAWWVAWRRGIVSRAAATRVTNMKAEVARHRLMLRVIEHRDRLLVALDKAKSRDELRTKFSKILSCSADEADYVLAVAVHRLATLEVSPITAKIKDLTAKIKDNEHIVSLPDARLVQDLRAAIAAVVATNSAAVEARKSDTKTKKRKRRGARRSRS